MNSDERLAFLAWKQDIDGEGSEETLIELWRSLPEEVKSSYYSSSPSTGLGDLDEYPDDPPSPVIEAVDDQLPEPPTHPAGTAPRYQALDAILSYFTGEADTQDLTRWTAWLEMKSSVELETDVEAYIVEKKMPPISKEITKAVWKICKSYARAKAEGSPKALEESVRQIRIILTTIVKVHNFTKKLSVYLETPNSPGQQFLDRLSTESPENLLSQARSHLQQFGVDELLNRANPYGEANLFHRILSSFTPPAPPAASAAAPPLPSTSSPSSSSASSPSSSAEDPKLAKTVEVIYQMYASVDYCRMYVNSVMDYLEQLLDGSMSCSQCWQRLSHLTMTSYETFALTFVGPGQTYAFDELMYHPEILLQVGQRLSQMSPSIRAELLMVVNQRLSSFIRKYAEAWLELARKYAALLSEVKIPPFPSSPNSPVLTKDQILASWKQSPSILALAGIYELDTDELTYCLLLLYFLLEKKAPWVAEVLHRGLQEAINYGLEYLDDWLAQEAPESFDQSLRAWLAEEQAGAMEVIGEFTRLDSSFGRLMAGLTTLGKYMNLSWSQVRNKLTSKFFTDLIQEIQQWPRASVDHFATSINQMIEAVPSLMDDLSRALLQVCLLAELLIERLPAEIVPPSSYSIPVVHSGSPPAPAPVPVLVSVPTMLRPGTLPVAPGRMRFMGYSTSRFYQLAPSIQRQLEEKWSDYIHRRAGSDYSAYRTVLTAMAFFDSTLSLAEFIASIPSDVCDDVCYLVMCE